MKFLQGKDRNQVEIYAQCLDETIGSDNEVRVIDAFVSSLPFADLGFRMDYI